MLLSQMFLRQCFEIATPKILKSLTLSQSSVYHQTTNSPTDSFLEVLRKERIFKSLETFLKTLANLNFSNFGPLQKQISRKMSVSVLK